MNRVQRGEEVGNGGEDGARRRRDLAQIHLARARLGMPEDAYRALVRVAAGGVQRLDGGVDGGHTDSAGALAAPERQALLAALRERGWRPRPPAAPRAVRATPAAWSKEAVAGKVRALLLDGGYTDAYADAIAARSLGVARWQWLEYEGLTQLMQMLQIQARRRARGRSPA
jgi:phage gp16-like protein